MIYLEFLISFVVGGVIGLLAGWFLFKRKGKSPEELEDKFKVIAGDVLRQSSEDFLRLAGTKFGDAEKNVKNLVESVGTRVDKLEKEQNEQVGKLVAGIGQVLKTGQEISDSAKMLKTVLSSSGTAIGRWGEATLSNLLEKAGMAKGTDFDVQETVSGEGSSILRPDFTIRLPGGMTLAVDSKASLASLYEFEKAREEEQPEERIKHIENFIDGLRKKIRDLSSKEYQKYVDTKIPYVVMFVPIESALLEALQHDNDLYSEAQSKNVMLASRSIIIPLILLIRNGWEQYRVTENATKIKNEVEELKGRLETFFGHVGGIGLNISQATKKFNEAIGSFETRVRPEIDRINDLGGNIPVGEGIKRIEEEPRVPKKLLNSGKSEKNKK
ncbi:MAG: DNA recombination protein RmuC [Candidatus Jorgensenbacteria bacterium]